MQVHLRKHLSEEFNTMTFVIQARGKENLICVRNGIAKATDLYRVHEAFTSLTDGFYKVLKERKKRLVLEKIDDEKDLSFPDTEHIYPEENECKVVSVDLSGDNEGANTGLILRNLAVLEKENVFNADYFNKFPAGRYYFRTKGSGKPVAFTNSRVWGCVMPVNIPIPEVTDGAHIGKP